MGTPRLKRSLRATFLGMAVNAFLAGIKLLAGALGHSHALVADGVESLADILSSVIVWRGLVVAAAPADENHPYGHGKAEPIAAAMVSTLLLLAASWIAVKSLQEIVSPHQAPAPFTLLVLVLVVVVKELLYRFVVSEAQSVESHAVHSDAWHHRSDAVTSLAAGIGITVALIGGKGYEAADDVAALIAAGIIAWNGWQMLRPSLDELMDTSPTQTVINPIRNIAAGVVGVQRVEKCVVRKMGYQYFVDMHVEVDPSMTVREAHEIAHRVKDAVRNRLPKVFDVLVHIEPGSAAAD
ncbi:MAG: cation diffusion facilitator family transporter [Verrucomicrobiales bacterium]|nr:cation diffusion facilitator family transporter [Verrucomicrobiales bacterium]